MQLTHTMFIHLFIPTKKPTSQMLLQVVGSQLWAQLGSNQRPPELWVRILYACIIFFLNYLRSIIQTYCVYFAIESCIDLLGNWSMIFNYTGNCSKVIIVNATKQISYLSVILNNKILLERKKSIIMEKQVCIRALADVDQINSCKVKIKSKEISMNNLSYVLGLFGNDVRFKILYLLNEERELCVCDLSDI